MLKFNLLSLAVKKLVPLGDINFGVPENRFPRAVLLFILKFLFSAELAAVQIIIFCLSAANSTLRINRRVTFSLRSIGDVESAWIRARSPKHHANCFLMLQMLPSLCEHCNLAFQCEWSYFHLEINNKIHNCSVRLRLCLLDDKSDIRRCQLWEINEM